MRITLKPVAVLLLPVLLAASPAFAQQARVVDAAALQQALVDRTTVEATQRASGAAACSIAPRCSSLASRMGLNLADARTAVGTLSGQQLGRRGRAGQRRGRRPRRRRHTIVISATTLLLIIIIIILLAQ